MVWSGYMDETNYTAAEYNSDDEQQPHDDDLIVPRNRPMEYHDWVTWHHEHLMNMWMSIKQYTQDSATGFRLFDQMNWNDFCEFSYQFSCKLPA